MQEESDQRHRWLLLFTRPLDLPVWDTILQLAERRKAAVVAVSFTTQPELQTLPVSQEMLERQHIFLKAVSLRVRTRAVSLAWYEESSAHVLARIMTMTREFQCDSLLLGSWKGQGFFLSREIAHALYTSLPAKSVLLQLPEQRENNPGFNREALVVSGYVNWSGTQVTCFTIRAGRPRAGLKTQAYDRRTEKEPRAMPGARILLIEDDAVLRALLQRNLEARQHQVRVAVDAQSALTSLRTGSFDLVILDINLPDQTGWEVLRMGQHEGCLQAQQLGHEAAKLPVIVVSAVRVSLVRLKEFPLLAYLPKPFPIEALLRLAEEAAQRGRRRVQSA